MRFIDAHTHPGFSSPTFAEAAKDNKINYSLDGLLEEMDNSGVGSAVAIGWNFSTNEEIARIAEQDERFIPVFGIRIAEIETYIAAAKEEFKEGRFRGFKIFLGYEPVYPYDEMFEPIYGLAEKYGVPVIFHTGDTWNSMVNHARVRFAHPLNIDDVAVAHPDMKIVIAHSGNPWFEDTAEIIYKNENCYADISGWFLGDIEDIYGNMLAERLKFLVHYASSQKLMFGTDWPLIKLERYADFLKGCGMAESYIENIAHRTAEKVWDIK